MSKPGEALLKHGWQYKGICGKCGNKLKLWEHPERKGEEIKTSKQSGFFFHLVGRHNVKTDRLANLPEYLKTL